MKPAPHEIVVPLWLIAGGIAAYLWIVHFLNTAPGLSPGG